MLNSVFSFVVALGILIFVHEFGHYWVARRCGVKVIQFSIGFGKPIFQKISQKTGVLWSVGWMPLGGFVRMLDERDPDSQKGYSGDFSDAFNRKPVSRRIAVVLAGPLANLLLAALLYAVASYVQTSGVKPVVGAPKAGSYAEQLGLRSGDEILSVNGTDIRKWSEVNWEIFQAKLLSGDLNLIVNRGGQTHTLASDNLTFPADVDLSPSLANELGFYLFEDKITIKQVAEGSVAQEAGFKVGDRLLSFNGISIDSSTAFTRAVQASAGKAMRVEVERDGQAVFIEATPGVVTEKGQVKIGRLGLGLGGSTDVVDVPLNPLQAVSAGFAQMLEVSVFTLAAFGKMITGDLGLHHLSGPVAIASAAGQSSSLGVIPFIVFLGMISVSLGILNLLPIPVLDGGHLMYYFAEIIRGKPIDEVWLARGQKVGILLIGLMTCVAFYNDLHRILF